MKLKLPTFLLLALTLGGFVSTGTAERVGLQIDGLRCESLINPKGIDVREPRLSWQFRSGERGQRQTAYQIRVAGSSAALSAGQANLWDTGKVISDQSIHIAYAGSSLTSRQQCFWQVRVWDKDGQPSAWSAPAHFSVGLLAASDWQAKWIGRDESPATNALNPLVRDKAQWIWVPGERGAEAAPTGTRYFRRTFDLPADRKIRRADLVMCADNQFTATLNGAAVNYGGSFKTASAIEVTASLRVGPNLLSVMVVNASDAPNPAGLVGRLRIEYANGETWIIPTAAGWQAGLAADDAGAWRAAEVLGPVGITPWGELSVVDEDRRLAARMLRREFAVTKPVARATVYYSGLGLSELYLNGAKVGDEVLSPGLTDYTKRVFYLTADVTRQVRSGANALGVWLGNGRYYAPRDQVPTPTVNYGYPKLLLQLEVEYADGTRDTVISDESWKLTTVGPIVANNEYDGEEYDARREFAGWDCAGFPDADWQPAQLVSAPGGQLVAPMIDPIRVTGTIKPVKLSEPKPGVFIFDLGQNLVGWCRLKVSGPAGTTVNLRHAELLKPDGTLYLDNIRSAKVTDRYTLKGGAEEVYEPRFAYHGFRFVEVTGYPGRPILEAITACVVNDDLASAGSFDCSQPTINRIYTNILWGVRGNYRSLPTDCPQRDERQGWLGDRSAESKGEGYLFRNGLLYAKWVQDMADAQRPDGSVPDVCPAYWPMYNDNVTWPSSLVIIPGALLDQFGDTQTIARVYPNMVKWVEHMSGFITSNLMVRDIYGDWCVPPENPKLIHSQDPARKTAGPILGTTYFFHCLELMARYATLLEKPADADRFVAMAGKLKAGLNDQFLKRDLGRYDNGAQTASVLPLAFGMVPEDQRQRVFDRLVNKITNETDGHIGTGLVGGQWLNRVLTDGGRPDIVYRFATNISYPSWGYMVEQGATTIWELWNGDTADPAMNSGNHVMLVGDFVIWLHESLAGIRPDPVQPGFKHIIMQPHLVGDLRWVKATHQSQYGEIISDWEHDGSTFIWRVTVPVNTTATLFIPSINHESVLEGGVPASSSPGLKFIRMENDSAVFIAQSGTYHFKTAIK